LHDEGHVLLVRINHEGGLDESFGDQGLAYTSMSETYRAAYALVIQDNNYVVLGGLSNDVTSGSDFILSRYIVEDVVATHEQKAISLSCVPNPCNDYFFVNVERPYDKFHCSIYDSVGRLTMKIFVQADAKGSLSIDVSKLNPGFYSVLFESKTLTVESSIIIN
jgi:hypothetical protein